MISRSARLFSTGAVVCAVAIAAVAAQTQSAVNSQSPARCRIEGHVWSGSIPLPGVSIVVHDGDVLETATSTGPDGKYLVLVAAGRSHRVALELTGFSEAVREVVAGQSPCDQVLEVQLTLLPRSQSGTQRGSGPTSGQRAGQRFQTLNAQPNGTGVALFQGGSAPESEEVGPLLPSGFSVEAAESDAIAITGSNDATNLDRGALSGRQQAIALDQLDPSAQSPPVSLNPQGAPGPRGGLGGPGGRGGLVLGGRGGRGQSSYQGSVTYTFGGSSLDSPPYQLRPDVPATQPPFARNTFSGTFGGPLKIPGLYSDSSRRTSFQVNYTGNESRTVFDQYATVPTSAMRNGDFSASPNQLIDPATGLPFVNNQIPAGRVDPSAQFLLQYIPAPNLPGTSQNFHTSTTQQTSSDAVSLRITQNLSPVVGTPGAGRGGAGGFGGGRFGGAAGASGRGGDAGVRGRGTNIVLNAQLQYRRNENELVNVFPGLGGSITNDSLSAPISLNVARGRSIQNFTVNVTRASTIATNPFAGVQNVAALAGIQYPAGLSNNPLNWGVPTLSFSGFTGVRGASASERVDERLTAGYSSSRAIGTHRVRIGGDYRHDASTSTVNGNARGSFTFTGAYSSPAGIGTPTGADFADFLLGLPQQAALQVGGTSQLRQHGFDAYVEDNWQAAANLTFNLGLRYELALPYVDANDRMANLDVSPDFHQAVVVLPGLTGPFSGAFPSGLLNDDRNNLGPRVGVAYRTAKNLLVRGGYSITYNTGSYASIARQLVGQPPFSETETVVGSSDNPLTLAEALLSSNAATTNNFGVARDYALGMIQTWNATATRTFRSNWIATAGYTGTKGSDLDVLRAPNLGPDGPLIVGVQPFIWESSGGRSIMHALNFQFRKRLSGGFSGGVSYTVARAMDNASSLGAGGPVVAQNDSDLSAEWAPSSFERRQQLSGDFYVELPWGTNRHWLNDGGLVAALFGDWSAQFSWVLQSGAPLTARVLGAASDLLRGVDGSLRANYSGVPIQLASPTVDEFFNVTAFSAPLPGAFGTSARNMIVGPGTRQLNGLFQRDVHLGANRVITVQVNATNLLNTAQWASVDTNVNSPTFGEVTSARPMRVVTLSARLRF